MSVQDLGASSFSDDLFSIIFRLFDGKNDCLQETYICAAAGRVQVNGEKASNPEKRYPEWRAVYWKRRLKMFRRRFYMGICLTQNRWDEAGDGIAQDDEFAVEEMG